MRDTLAIDPRYCGPPDTGNGGYVGGCLAVHLGGDCAQLTLKAPVPVGTPLQVEHAEGAVVLSDAGRALAVVKPAVLDWAPLGAPTHAQAAAVVGQCRGFENHPFPRDFVSGPERLPGDGLAIRPGPVGPGVVAAPWVVHTNFCNADGQLDPVFVWAALDSTSSFPLLEDSVAFAMVPWVLGRLTVAIDAPVPAEAEVRVQAWTLGREGRKGTTRAALYNERGEPLARAEALWISLQRDDR
ncbi:MAG: hypothetical protein SV583_06865 [Pseudomonadota bacterium]|nr:hypothetical protein [Pseudomonadota bacterium]